MARSPRITNSADPTVYHLISRTTLVGYPIGDVEKNFFVELVHKFSRVYFVDVLGFCCMGNHFHLLVRMFPDGDYSDDEIRERFAFCYGRRRKLLDGQIPLFRERWSNVSEFMKDVKVGFTRFYNGRHGHKGYFWGDRFKSVIVEDGEALVNCLAYIDLNPVRAGLVVRPEDYRWSGVGWHVQTGNADGFLSFDFGLDEYGVLDPTEKLRKYRQFLYEIGALDHGKGAVLDAAVLVKESENDYELSRVSRFRYRTKYFTDSGIIGSKRFVTHIYNSVKHRLPFKRDKVPHRINGLDGIFSLKKFVEDKRFYAS